MSRILRVLVVAASLAALGQGILARTQGPQVPERDTRPTPKTGTCRIRGRVLVAGTDQPVRRATVQLLSPTAAERTVISDANGKFEFAGLPPGRFRVSASKDGSLPGHYGGRRVGELGKIIELADGQAVDRADITLFHAGAIGGRVVDEFGDPVMNANVTVMKRQTSGAGRLFASFTYGRTDDLGRYRVSGLWPGDYFVAAGLPAASTPPEVPDVIRDGYARTYYPGTTDVSQAQAVSLGLGQEATADMAVAPVPLGRVSGTVVDARGRPAGGGSFASLSAYIASVGGLARLTGGSLHQDGTFIYDLPPGEYVLMATHIPGNPALPSPRGQTEVGLARVTVIAGLDVTGVTICTSAGAIVSGRVILEGTRSPVSVKGLTVSTLRTDVSDPAALTVANQVSADGVFVLNSLFGHQAIRVSHEPAGWALKAVYVSGRDVVDSGFVFEGRERIEDVQVVLTDKVTHLTGSVADDAGEAVEGAYVEIFSEDSAQWTLHSRYRASTLFEKVPFKIDGLPPGNYFAVALTESPSDLDLLAADVVSRLRKAGTPFSLKEGETVSVTLKVLEAVTAMQANAVLPAL